MVLALKQQSTGAAESLEKLLAVEGWMGLLPGHLNAICGAGRTRVAGKALFSAT